MLYLHQVTKNKDTLHPITSALPRTQEDSRNTHSNATRRTSRPYRWARQRARDTVSDQAGWQGDQGIRTRQQRGVYRFPFLYRSSIPFSRSFASRQSSTSSRSPPCDRQTRRLAEENLNACIYACMRAAACQTQTFHVMPCNVCPPLVPTHSTSFPLHAHVHTRDRLP